jgi:hypothetical protein
MYTATGFYHPVSVTTLGSGYWIWLVSIALTLPTALFLPRDLTSAP